MTVLAPVTIDEIRRLDVLTAGWDPFSRDEHLWHGCPGHEWERFDFDLSRGAGTARVERVTRCGRCGAPRCDALRDLRARELFRVVKIVGRHHDVLAPTSQDDDVVQFRRCTFERHHVGEHDHLELPE